MGKKSAFNMVLRSLFKRIENIRLSMKIILIILFALILTTGASVIGLNITTKSNNLLLYQALLGSLKYTSSDISKKLANIESLSGTIINSPSIYKSLVSITDDPTSEIKRSNAKNSIESDLVDLYQNYRNNGIINISISSKNFLAESYPYLEPKIPSTVNNVIISSSQSKNGYPVWNTDYCNSHGLFLGRTIRRVSNHAFDDLGTVIISVNMDNLIHSSANSVFNNGSISYILYENGSEIYHTKDLEENTLNKIKMTAINEYCVINVSDHRYFAVKGQINSFPYTYVCLIPYDSVYSSQFASVLTYIIIIFLTVIISLLLSQVLVRSISKDVDHLVTKMDSFGKDEKMELPIETKYQNRKDEIGILNNQFDIMAQNMQGLIKENYINQILTKDAQIKALESQINPHFLYNTLESINWRAKAIGEQEISQMIESLGTLLRATLSKEKKIHTIEDELKIVNSYITIQSIRFSDRLLFTQDVSPDMFNIEIPKLTIQPLVENAINYSIENIIDACQIKISGKVTGHAAIISVSNNGSQFEDDFFTKLQNGLVKSHGFGVGLNNIQKRLQLMYGMEYGLRFYNEDDDIAVVQIIIPVKYYADEQKETK